MSSRDKIFAALDACAPAIAEPAPPIDGPWTRYPDRLAQFSSALMIAAATLHRLPNESALRARFEAECSDRSASGDGDACVVSTCAGLDRDDVGLHPATDPHALAVVTHGWMPGVFGVAENGAIWIAPQTPCERALMVLAEHLHVVLPADAIVDHMADAYRRLSAGGVLGHEGRGYGVFLAGPSKTADIEQSLVIGAHGPRSLSVYLVGEK